MNESITDTTKHFSPAASLAAIGVKLSQLDLFGPILAQVQIKQKTVKHTPIGKLTDAFISLLASSKSIRDCVSIQACNVLLDERPVPSNRSCRRRWIPVQLKMWSNCIRRLMRSIALTVKAFNTAIRLLSNSWMWT